jgi:hypothetical protein
MTRFIIQELGAGSMQAALSRVEHLLTALGSKPNALQENRDLASKPCGSCNVVLGACAYQCKEEHYCTICWDQIVQDNPEKENTSRLLCLWDKE